MSSEAQGDLTTGENADVLGVRASFGELQIRPWSRLHDPRPTRYQKTFASAAEVNMDVTIALDHRFWRTPDGRCWSQTVFPRGYWSRYLTVFSEVRILARVHETAAPSPTWTRVDGDRVTVTALPGYLGPWQFLLQATRVRAAIDRAVADPSAILLRVPGLISSIANRLLIPGRPYGLEVLGDPYDVFAPGAIPHPLRPLLRYGFTKELQRQCRAAPCSLYVTRSALQRRYPPPRARSGSPETFSIGVSDVELPEDAFVHESQLPDESAYQPNAGRNGRFAIIFVGMLEVPYKAADVLLDAFARCVRSGLDAGLTIVGDGRIRPQLERLAHSLCVDDRVRFLGSLPSGGPVREQLDASDLFVLPSRVEGLPRAMLEAMARGLPCIGTSIGGMRELLPREALVPPGHAGELTAKILEVSANPIGRAGWARNNLARAREYSDDVLQPKRVSFYQHLRDLTSTWQRTHH